LHFFTAFLHGVAANLAHQHRLSLSFCVKKLRFLVVSMKRPLVDFNAKAQRGQPRPNKGIEQKSLAKRTEKGRRMEAEI
jgi:hypothetical protein